jgi:hypothetical protein
MIVLTLTAPNVKGRHRNLSKLLGDGMNPTNAGFGVAIAGAGPTGLWLARELALVFSRVQWSCSQARIEGLLEQRAKELGAEIRRRHELIGPGTAAAVRRCSEER